VVTEGLGHRRFHGRVVLLVNEHTASAGEMVSAFAEENNLATIVGTKTPGRLLSGSAYKVGHGYQIPLRLFYAKCGAIRPVHFPQTFFNASRTRRLVFFLIFTIPSERCHFNSLFPLQANSMWYFPSVWQRSHGRTFGIRRRFRFRSCLYHRFRYLHLFSERNRCALGTLSIFASGSSQCCCRSRPVCFVARFLK
jgi:hypothetical protein